jgi:hypothetical protein
LIFSHNQFLLNTSFSNSFSSVVKPGYLYSISVFFVILTAIVVVATYYNLYKKTKETALKKNIEQSLEQWLTEVMIHQDSADVVAPLNFESLLKNLDARQMVIDELVRNKSSFLGSVSDNIIKLYCRLGLNVDSRIKLDDPRSHVQCQGIHELCVMEQKDQLQKVYRFTNSKDNDVRIEAQTAVLQWFGFKGLRFLDVVSSPLTEFQQLKLLELLRQLPFGPMPRLSKWLQSKNESVVNFALKLAEHYKQVQVLHEAGLCLQHENEAVRVQAVKTLASIGDSSTANLLTTVYQNERFTNRLNILNQLPKLAGDEQRDFLIVQLHEGHEHLKLASAKVLAKCTSEGMEILEAKSYDRPIPYKDIYLHVKSEASR